MQVIKRRLSYRGLDTQAKKIQRNPDVRETQRKIVPKRL